MYIAPDDRTDPPPPREVDRLPAGECEGGGQLTEGGHLPRRRRRGLLLGKGAGYPASEGAKGGATGVCEIGTHRTGNEGATCNQQKHGGGRTVLSWGGGPDSICSMCPARPWASIRVMNVVTSDAGRPPPLEKRRGVAAAIAQAVSGDQSLFEIPPGGK